MITLTIPTPPSTNARKSCRPSDEEVVETYEAMGSCRAAGEMLGIAPQTVHKRLVRLGKNVPQRVITEAEREHIRQYYAGTQAEEFSLADLAERMGRTRQLISRAAKEMGLTRYRPLLKPAREKMSASLRSWHASNEHPRGMSGKKHGAASLEKIAAAGRRQWAMDKAFGIGQMSDEARERRRIRMAQIAAVRPAHANYSRGLGGKRSDLGDAYFRSRWEANYARYLNLLMRLGVVQEWAYEPEVFWFKGVRRGTTNYRPDFRVVYKDDPTPVYIEIKGWVTPKDRTKWKRMAKYHPHIKLEIVAEKQFKALAKKWAAAIPNWEAAR